MWAGQSVLELTLRAGVPGAVKFIWSIITAGSLGEGLFPVLGQGRPPAALQDFCGLLLWERRGPRALSAASSAFSLK